MQEAETESPSGRLVEIQGSDVADLIVAAREDPAAFAAIYRRYVNRVYAYLYHRVANKPDAEDLTARTFTEALESFHRYEERGSFTAWLFTIPRRVSIDHYRKQRPQIQLDEVPDPGNPGDDPLDHVIAKDRRARLSGLLAGLDDDELEMLELRFAVALKYREIGAFVGRSEGAVKMAIHLYPSSLRMKSCCPHPNPRRSLMMKQPSQTARTS